jgi:plasmid replication initiation protein
MEITMIREIVKPKSTNITINIPKEYVGKQIEYIVFPLDNDIISDDKIVTQKSISSLKGVLNKYADPSKVELEDEAWRVHIEDKYKIDD